MSRHKVLAGECLASIAAAKGFAPQTLWNHPENATLKAKRDPNVLLPGDDLFLPERASSTMSCAAGTRHTFRVKGTSASLKVRLLCGEEPRANEAYALKVDGDESQGKTDGDGWIRASIPAAARQAVISLKDGAEVFALKLGELDPAGTISGAQARLMNLGLFFGATDGALSRDLEEAVALFQEAAGLDITGELDEATHQQLKRAHGS